MNGKLIVLEGIDGSGKATQSGLWRIILLRGEKTSCIFLFLIMEVPSSALVKMYLNGDFGRAPGM